MSDVTAMPDLVQLFEVWNLELKKKKSHPPVQK
jgi:hypothetical protein